MDRASSRQLPAIAGLRVFYKIAIMPKPICRASLTAWTTHQPRTSPEEAGLLWTATTF